MPICRRSCITQRKEKTMTEYFREEKIRFKYFPAFYLTRILFTALVFILGQMQWAVMAIAASLSYGFRYDTEAEHFIPLSVDEMIKRRRTRLWMIWLRYAVLGFASLLLHYLMLQNGIYIFDVEFSVLLRHPAAAGAFFILQMAFVYSSLLSSSIRQINPVKKRLPMRMQIFDYVFRILPNLVFFTYGIGLHHRWIENNPVWIHCCIILTAAVLLIIYNFVKSKTSGLADYTPNTVKKGA